MTEQILWRLGVVSLIICFMFLATFFVSFYFYKLTAGRIYKTFNERPKRFLFTSFIASLLFAIASVIPDLLTLLLKPILTSSVNTNSVVLFAIMQFLLITMLGSPLMWLSYRFGISMAHKIFFDRF